MKVIHKKILVFLCLRRKKLVDIDQWFIPMGSFQSSVHFH